MDKRQFLTVIQLVPAPAESAVVESPPTDPAPAESPTDPAPAESSMSLFILLLVLLRLRHLNYIT
jgi:hypothetical protein